MLIFDYAHSSNVSMGHTDFYILLMMMMMMMTCAVNPILTYGNSFQDFLGREHSEVVFGGRPGILQLAQGHTGWLYSQEIQRGIKFPTSVSVARYLNH